MRGRLATLVACETLEKKNIWTESGLYSERKMMTIMFIYGINHLRRVYFGVYRIDQAGARSPQAAFGVGRSGRRGGGGSFGVRSASGIRGGTDEGEWGESSEWSSRGGYDRRREGAAPSAGAGRRREEQMVGSGVGVCLACWIVGLLCFDLLLMPICDGWWDMLRLMRLR